MQELPDEADVSLGQMANVKKILADREWIDAEPSGLSLRSSEAGALPLLKEWAASYRFSRNFPADYYSLKPIPQMEAELAADGRRLNVRVGFTGFSGAARFAPAVRYQRITAYAGGDITPLLEQLALKPVSSGATVTIMQPYDEGVFYGICEMEDAPIVSPVQLYLDLKQTKGCGEEAAAAILEEVIKPRWR